MVKITATVAGTRELCDRDFRFNHDDLATLARAAPGIPVYTEFAGHADRHVIGTVETARVCQTFDGEYMEIELTVPGANREYLAAFYIVPMVEIDEGNRFTRLIEFAITDNPADKSLSPARMVRL